MLMYGIKSQSKHKKHNSAIERRLSRTKQKASLPDVWLARMKKEIDTMNAITSVAIKADKEIPAEGGVA